MQLAAEGRPRLAEVIRNNAALKLRIRLRARGYRVIRYRDSSELGIRKAKQAGGGRSSRRCCWFRSHGKEYAAKAENRCSKVFAAYAENRLK